MMVVEVLITSCQVSENLNSGPTRPQTTTRATQTMKVSGRPVQPGDELATGVKALLSDMAYHPASHENGHA